MQTPVTRHRLGNVITQLRCKEVLEGQRGCPLLPRHGQKEALTLVWKDGDTHTHTHTHTHTPYIQILYVDIIHAYGLPRWHEW